jgi:electron transfer flavoprotein alpha subunit
MLMQRWLYLGRGLKDLLGMIEELATVMMGSNSFSKPVSDLGWRPHGEHVRTNR